MASHAAAEPLSPDSQIIAGAGMTGAGQLVDVRLGISFHHESRRALLRRESAAGGASTLSPELELRQSRNVVTLRGDLGLLGGVSLYAAAPLVLSDDRALSFASGVDSATSTSLRDGFLAGRGLPSYGWDSEAARPFEAPDTRVFRGPTRRGLAHLALGLSFALMNARRYENDPTWIAQLEGRLSTDEDQRYDPGAPRANTAVGPGYHELIARTRFSRRVGKLQPSIGGHYAFAVATEGGPFKGAQLGTGEFSRPQQRAGAETGIDMTAWQAPASQLAVTVGLRVRAELRLAGLAQSDLWEVLSGSAFCASDSRTCRPQIDRDRNGDGSADPNPGITRSPAYGTAEGELIVGAALGPYVKVRALGALLWEQARFLSDGGSNDVAYDSPGRRFFVEGVRVWRAGAEAAVSF